MALFFINDEERFTGAAKTGFPLYKSVLESSWKEFLAEGFLTLLFYVPFAGGMVYAVLSKSLLAALLAGVVGGAVSGPAHACLYDLILRRLRGDRADWWTAWKRAFRLNLRAAILPGVIQCSFLGQLIFGGALVSWGAAPLSWGTVFLVLSGAVLLTMILTVWWAQIVLFEQTMVLRLKNSLFFCIFHFWRMLGCALLQIAWLLILALFMPWTAFLIPFLGIWYCLFLALFMIYPRLNEDFRIEEQIEEKFPGSMDE